MREYGLTLLVTAAVTYLLTPLVRRLAIRGGALHEARDRDVHVVPIPRWGGLAMYAGLGAGLLAASSMFPLGTQVLSGSGMAPGLLVAGGLIVALGVVDDRWGLNALTKLIGQIGAGAILVASNTELTWLPMPGGQTLGLDRNQQIVLTILVVVATINAVNFVDGLDGLAAGIVAIAALSFYIYYYWLAHSLRLSAEAQPALAAAILAGMCLGFLPHNFYPARIFMGDTGSMLLGLLLAYIPISSLSGFSFGALRQYNVNRFPEVLPLLLPAMILVIPYADMLMAVIRRTRAGVSPFAPDRKHLHHRLLDIGHSHRLSVLIMYLWAALFSGLVVWFATVRTPLFVFAAITLAAIVALLLMSMPRLRWWSRGLQPAGIGAPTVAAAARPVTPAAAVVAHPSPGTPVPPTANGYGRPVPLGAPVGNGSAAPSGADGRDASFRDAPYLDAGVRGASPRDRRPSDAPPLDRLSREELSQDRLPDAAPPRDPLTDPLPAPLARPEPPPETMPPIPAYDPAALPTHRPSPRGR